MWTTPLAWFVSVLSLPCLSSLGVVCFCWTHTALAAIKKAESIAQETVDLIGVLKEHLKFRHTPHIQTKVMMSMFGLFPRIDVTSWSNDPQRVSWQGVSKASNLVAPKTLTAR